MSPAFAEQNAMDQLQTSADTSTAATQTHSADKAKSTAAKAFRDNKTNLCLCEKSDDSFCDCADPLDAILAGHATDKKNNKYKSPESSDDDGQPVLSGGESDTVLLKQAADNAKNERIAKEQAEQAAKDSDDDFDNVLVGAVAGAVATHAIMGNNSHKKTGGKSGTKASGCKAKCQAVGADWDGEYLDNGGCLCVM